jgi:fused signal recognition particle receptor
MSEKEGLFSRLRKTRESLSSGLARIFSSSPKISEGLYEEIEDQLIMADLGVQTTQTILSALRKKAAQSRVESSDGLLRELKSVILDLLKCSVGEEISTQGKRPFVILMVGVNGVGKTTTMAKMANHYRNSGNRVLLAACDTFRAAAIEQLQSWGQRLDIPVIAQSHGADAAAVAYDAYSAAQARDMDYLLIDSAGRQHTHGDLMDQLQKIKRVLGRVDENAPHEVFLTVDAGNGQNVISQVENFDKAIPLTGLCVTKLDGTARGGVVISLADRFKLPIRYIGVGEGVDDLRPFIAEDFVDALLPELAES